MKYSYLFFLVVLLFSCQMGSSDLDELFDFPQELKEVSGITYNDSTKLIWALQDRGNANEIYGFQLDGGFEKSLVIADATNRDWEDITTSSFGDIYIGDFGNNANDRKDLCIYKVDQSELEKEVAYSAYKIEFSYPEQTEFPPSKEERYYDVEGFFEFQEHFYLFTKNRSKNFDGTSFIYQIPNAPGVHTAQLVGTFKTCTNYNRCAVTSVALSPNKDKIAILTQNKLILFQDFKGDKFLEGKRTDIDLNHFSQKEGIVFKDEQTLLIADERNKKSGGKLYRYHLNN